MSNNVVKKNKYNDFKDVKTNKWIGILYPESLPENWLSYLMSSGAVFALSPLHDKDTVDDDFFIDSNTTLVGDFKKPHYHIIYIHPAPTTQHFVNSLFFKPLNQMPPVPCSNVNAYYDYFTHKYFPDKYQYSELDIQVFNGFDIRYFCDLKWTEVQDLLNYLQLYIMEKGINNYFLLCQDLLESNNLIALKVARSNSQLVMNLISEFSRLVMDYNIDEFHNKLVSFKKLQTVSDSLNKKYLGDLLDD